MSGPTTFWIRGWIRRVDVPRPQWRQLVTENGRTRGWAWVVPTAALITLDVLDGWWRSRRIVTLSPRELAEADAAAAERVANHHRHSLKDEDGLVVRPGGRQKLDQLGTRGERAVYAALGKPWRSHHKWRGPDIGHADVKTRARADLQLTVYCARFEEIPPEVKGYILVTAEPTTDLRG